MFKIEIRYVLDRFEGEYALLEDREMNIIAVRAEELPENAKEGDCILLVNDAYIIDEAKTHETKTRIRSLFDRLKE